ncbi:MAG: hypothetical protein ACPHCN_14250 [Mycobacterium sp.]
MSDASEATFTAQFRGDCVLLACSVTADVAEVRVHALGPAIVLGERAL